MSEVQTNKQPSFSLAQSVIGIAITITTTLVTVGVFTGNLSQRVTTLEESNKKVEQKLDKIEEKMINRFDYEKDQRRTDGVLSEIKNDLKEIRKK